MAHVAEKFITEGNYTIQGYLDLRIGEVRVCRKSDGKQVAYLGQTKDYSEWCGVMKQSKYIKNLVQKMVKDLEAEFKAQ